MEVGHREEPDGTHKYPESNLISAGKYAILAVQLNGYLPLSIVKGKLTIKYSAIPFILQWLFNMLVLSSGSFIYVHPDEFYNSLSRLAHVEKLIMYCLSALATTVGLYFRVHGMWTRKSTLKFWDDTVKLLAAFENKSFPGLDEKLSDVGNSVRNLFVCIAFFISGYIGIKVSLAFIQSRSEYWEYYRLSKNPWAFAASTVITIFLLLREFHGIWLLFFFKIYTSLFSLLETKLRNIEISSDDVSTVILSPKLEWEMDECYKLYTKVEYQTREFSLSFQKQLISESVLAVFCIVFYTFAFIRSGHSSLEGPSNLMFTILLLMPVAINGKRLYEFGTEGSRLTAIAFRISDQLLNLYYATEGNHNSRLRQDLETFALRIRTSPPKLDAGQYFAFHGNWLTAVSSHFEKGKSMFRKQAMYTLNIFCVYRLCRQ